MPVSAKQLNFSSISNDFDKFYNQNQETLLSLLDEFINISNFIPFSFYQNYYSKIGSKRDFSLESMLNAFILKNILSIPSIDLLITILSISPNIREFCGFLKVPHKSQFSRFKSEYLNDFHVITNLQTDNNYRTPRLLTLTLPQRFRNRSRVEVLLILREFRTTQLLPVERRIALDLVLKVDSINLNTSSPNVKLYAYLEERLEMAPASSYTFYHDIGFDLIVIGY